MAEENNNSSGSIFSGTGENDVSLDLSLACYNPNAGPNSSHVPGEQEISLSQQELVAPPPTADNEPRTLNDQRSGRAVSPTVSQRSNSPLTQRNDIIPVPYPWATDRRAVIHDLKTLVERKIFNISGDVECRRCSSQYQMEYDLTVKLPEVLNYFVSNKDSMHQRAPRVWMNPVLSTCKLCNQVNCVKPIISKKKESINWLFLLLGQALGCCTIEQLKYFCQYTENHRTGAKDRVLYLTYLTLCRQLVSYGPFDK